MVDYVERIYPHQLTEPARPGEELSAGQELVLRVIAFGFTPDEVAQRFGITRSQVNRLAYQAIERLHQHR